jgi:hypothetical protein
MKKLLIVDLGENIERDINILESVLDTSGWKFEKIDFDKIPYQTDRARREVLLQKKNC